MSHSHALPTLPSAQGARVVAPYAHTLWDAAHCAGLDETAMSAVLGRTAIGEADLPVPALRHAARAQAGPLFGWQLGQQVKPTTYGVNGILLQACPTGQAVGDFEIT